MPAMRSLSRLDHIIGHLDNVLRTLSPKAATAQRESPANDLEEATLTEQEQQHAAGLMRINHTGEVCAQALYQGQSVTAKLPNIRQAMIEAAEEEIDHLVWCEQRLEQLNSRTSLLNPAFYAMSYTVGAVAGALGDKWSLGFVAATENQVCMHLEEHLESLPEQDTRSRAVLNLMHEDELKHASTALEAGGVVFPSWFQKAMTTVSKVMTKSTYRI